MGDTDALSMDESTDDDFDDFVTLGKLSSFKTKIKWRFPNSTICPSCGISCSSRNVALVHFRNTHADTSMVCILCNILFGDAAKLLYHHAVLHPNHPPPKLKDNQKQNNNMTEVKKNVVPPQKSNESKKEEEEEDDDDLIILHGCGLTTQWKFPPNLKRCPVKSCLLQFGVRSDVITHYRKRHANHATLCPICVKPIQCKSRGLSAVKTHYNTTHPNEKFPYNNNNLSGKIKTEVKANIGKEVHTGSKNEKDDDEIDDLITLHGLGHVSQWRFPQDQKHCPVGNCLVKFSVRSDAIKHYKNQHASYSILCPICVKPICAKYSNEMFRHYKRMHPNQQFPYDLDTETKRKIKKEPKKSVDKMRDSDVEWEDNDDDVDDLIELKGLGETTFWYFPKNINHCPVLGCGLMFPSRSKAIDHYKAKHAAHFILCSICIKPISTQRPDIIPYHYRSIHPDTEMPSYIKARAKRPIEQHSGIEKEKGPTLKNNNGKVDQCEDDLITLYGCGKQTKWRFPEGLKCCPVQSCYSIFKTRREAIFHFKEQHAKHSILCTLCEKPIGVKKSHYFRIHYDKVHRNEKCLSEAKKKMTSCNICGKKMLACSIQQHIREKHTSEVFVCPLKGCEFEGKRQSYVRHHWNREHSNLEFPQIRKKSKFTFEIRTSRNIKQEAKAPNTLVSTVTSNAAIDQERPNTSVRQDTNTQVQQETPTIPTRQEDIESNESLLKPLRTASEASSSDEEINLQCPDCQYVSKTVFALKIHRDNKHNVLKKRKKKRMLPRPSYNYSTTTDTEDEQKVMKAAKRRRMVKKRPSDSGNHDSARDETPIMPQSEGLTSSSGQQQSRDTLTAPSNFVQAEADPLAIDEPIDLSIPKIFYVPDSEEEAEDVKPTIVLEDNSN